MTAARLALTLSAGLFVLRLGACTSTAELDEGPDDDDSAANADDDDSAANADDAASPVSNCELLQNTGAESGDTSSWKVTDGAFLAIGFEEGSYPQPYRGDFQFFAGQEAWSRMEQSVDVGKDLEVAGETPLYAHLRAQVRNWNGSDAPSLILRALDASGDLIVEQQSGPFLEAYWTEQRLDLPMPPETTRLVAALLGSRTAGTDNDSYFDDIDLCVDASPGPEISELRLGPWLGNPEPRAMHVLWETHTAMQGRISYGMDSSLSQEAEETGSSSHHELRLADLEPDATVYYQVEGPGLTSKIYNFRTPPDGPAPMSFVAWGDNQNGADTFRQLTTRMSALEPDLLVAAGDIVQNGYEENYQGQFLGPLGGISPTVPVLVSSGNHEYYGDGDATLFDLHLAQPADEHCFSLAWGNAWFLFIDSELSLGPGSPQYQCIEAAFDEPAFAAARLRTAVFHRPPRVEYWAGSCWEGEVAVRDYLEPLFEAVGLDLVLNGHNHLYAYTPPILPGGVTWVTTGGGGGHIDGEADYCTSWSEIEFTSFEHHILHVRVDETTVTVEAMTADGTVIHSFSL
jgi:hypothetical protein